MSDATADDGDETPRIFAGRFEYQKPLGKGAGGAVYLAEDLHNDRRQVALKVLSEEACESVQGKMLRREFEILSKLEHPNLVRVYDYGAMRDGGVYLAEEYIDGFSLQDARALLEPEVHMDVARQVLLGLAYLHGMGMIHRDVKPANIMLLWMDETSTRPLVKLVDFGLSSMDPGRDNLRGGTRSYMAPEIIRGNKGEFRSDLFSLGVSLYYALCGVLPFGPRSKKDPPPTEEPLDPPPPHHFNREVPLALSRFTMVLLRQVEGVEYEDAGEALQALARDTEGKEWWSAPAFGKSMDVAAAPVLRGYFERGILGRRVGERERLVEIIAGEDALEGEDADAETVPAESGRRARKPFALVRGGAEVGKSRLLADVTASLKIERCRVVQVDCDDEMQPWGLVHALLERIVELGASRGYDDIAYFKSYLLILERLSALDADESIGSRDSVEPEWLRRAFHRAVTTFQPARLVVVIDDLHAADRESQEFLLDCYLERSEIEMPAALATARPRELSELDVPLDELTIFDIEGLTRSDLRRFFESRLGLDDLPEEWVDRVAEHADGRPGYLEEVCRTLIDERILHRRSVASWHLDEEELEDFELPESMRASFRRRFATIGASGREALEVLALYERPVRWEVLREFIGSNRDSTSEADQTVTALCRRYLATMIIEVDGRYLELVDPVLGDVVRDLMSPSWERGLQRRIADRLEGEWREGEVPAAEVAAHRDASGELEDVYMWEVAGDEQWREATFDEAFEHYAAALEVEEDGRSRAVLLAKQARVLLAVYETDAARTTLERGIEAAERTGLEWLINSVCLTGAELALARGDDARVDRWIERLTDYLPSAGEQAPALVLLAAVARRAGEFETAETLLDQATRRIEHFGHCDIQVDVWLERAELAQWRGRADRVDDAYEEAREAASSFGGALDESRVDARQGVARRRQRRWKEASELLAAAFEELSRGRRPDLWIEALAEMALCCQALDDESGAHRHANDALVFAREFEDDMLLERVRFVRAEIRRETEGTVADSLDRMEEALYGMRTGSPVVPELLEMTARYRAAAGSAGRRPDPDLVGDLDERIRESGADGLAERLRAAGE